MSILTGKVEKVAKDERGRDTEKGRATDNGHVVSDYVILILSLIFRLWSRKECRSQ